MPDAYIPMPACLSARLPSCLSVRLLALPTSYRDGWERILLLNTLGPGGAAGGILGQVMLGDFDSEEMPKVERVHGESVTQQCVHCMETPPPSRSGAFCLG